MAASLGRVAILYPSCANHWLHNSSPRVVAAFLTVLLAVFGSDRRQALWLAVLWDEPEQLLGTLVQIFLAYALAH